MSTVVAFFWSIFLLAICILLLGYRAFKHKEIMALVKSGKELPVRKSSVDRNVVLVWAAVLIGNAAGLLLGVIVSLAGEIHEPLSIIIGIASMALCTGVALLICFFYLKKNYEK
jgi:hypothetical protein